MPYWFTWQKHYFRVIERRQVMRQCWLCIRSTHFKYKLLLLSAVWRCLLTFLIRAWLFCYLFLSDWKGVLLCNMLPWTSLCSPVWQWIVILLVLLHQTPRCSESRFMSPQQALCLSLYTSIWYLNSGNETTKLIFSYEESLWFSYSYY